MYILKIVLFYGQIDLVLDPFFDNVTSSKGRVTSYNPLIYEFSNNFSGCWSGRRRRNQAPQGGIRSPSSSWKIWRSTPTRFRYIYFTGILILIIKFQIWFYHRVSAGAQSFVHEKTTERTSLVSKKWALLWLQPYVQNIPIFETKHVRIGVVPG